MGDGQGRSCSGRQKRHTVRRWVADGKIRYKRAGRRVLKDVSKLPKVHDSDTTNVIDSGVTDDTVTIDRLEAELKGITREVARLEETLQLANRELEHRQWQAGGTHADY